MARRIQWFASCTIALVLFLAARAVGDGIILPDDPAHGQLAMVRHDVEVTAHDGLVTTHVDQVFRNVNPYAIEGRYVFPVPAGAAVSGLTMWVDGQAQEARLLDAGWSEQLPPYGWNRTADGMCLDHVIRRCYWRIRRETSKL